MVVEFAKNPRHLSVVSVNVTVSPLRQNVTGAIGVAFAATAETVEAASAAAIASRNRSRTRGKKPLCISPLLSGPQCRGEIVTSETGFGSQGCGIRADIGRAACRERVETSVVAGS